MTDCTGPTPKARQYMTAAVAAHLRGEVVAPLYLAGGPRRRVLALLGAAAVELCADRRCRRVLLCTGGDFVELWRATMRRGMIPFVRRALDAHDALLLDKLDALCDEPIAQWELARLITSDRLVVLAGPSHLYAAGWSAALAAHLAGATRVVLHNASRATDINARALIDRVAHYYGLPRATLLARRRTAHVALARQVAMWLLREEGLSYAAIGRLLRRDHTTVMHGHARIQYLAADRPGVRHDLDVLRHPKVA